MSFFCRESLQLPSDAARYVCITSWLQYNADGAFSMQGGACWYHKSELCGCFCLLELRLLTPCVLAVFQDQILPAAALNEHAAVASVLCGAVCQWQKQQTTSIDPNSSSIAAHAVVIPAFSCLLTASSCAAYQQTVQAARHVFIEASSLSRAKIR